jgi:hypothetical protein
MLGGGRVQSLHALVACETLNHSMLSELALVGALARDVVNLRTPRGGAHPPTSTHACTASHVDLSSNMTVPQVSTM